LVLIEPQDRHTIITCEEKKMVNDFDVVRTEGLGFSMMIHGELIPVPIKFMRISEAKKLSEFIQKIVEKVLVARPILKGDDAVKASVYQALNHEDLAWLKTQKFATHEINTRGISIEQYVHEHRRCSCQCSSGICGCTTFGTGKLYDNGFWEIPCPHGNEIHIC
jgi:hypothetical protein